MKTRRLGKNGPVVSDIGLGCMGMTHAYGRPADKRDMIELINDAIDMGVTLFDTAEIYGTYENPHENEELLGSALNGRRKDVVVSTKFGITFDNPRSKGPHPLVPDSTPKKIKESIERSLRRLKTDYIDIYFQHRIDPKVSPEEVAEVMNDLIKEGKILYWGISECDKEYLKRANNVCQVAAVQNRYSMMARWHENLFPALEALGIGFMAFSPLANGILTNIYSPNSRFDPAYDYRASMPQFSEESFEINEELFDYIENLAYEKHATPAQISLAWMINKKPWIVPIPGTKHLCRLKENCGADDVKLSQEEVEAIDKKLDYLPMSEVYGGAKILKAN